MERIASWITRGLNDPLVKKFGGLFHLQSSNPHNLSQILWIFLSDEMGFFMWWKHTETFLEQIFLAINNYHSIFAPEQVTNYPDEQRYGTEPRTDTEQDL